MSDHERTVADIERRLRRLSLSYDADIEAAERWRETSLANLDATATGYEEFVANVEVIYGELLADAYAADLERREDWRAGIQRGLDELIEDQMTWADAWENIVTGTIERGEDAWVEWVTTGRLSLQELVDFALEQFARLAYQRAIQPALTGIFDALGGVLGGGAPTPMVKSHSGSIMGAGSTMTSMSMLGTRDELAVIERGQGIFTPRQMENADALIRAIASRPPAAAGVLVQPKIEVNNYSSANVETRERADGTTEINVMDQVEREMAGRMQTAGSPLNRALRQDWSMRPVNPLRRTEMDDGMIAVERRMSRLSGIQTLSWEMSGAQFDLLVAFWAEDLNGGESWFQAPVVEGTRTVPRLVRFAADPPWQGTSPAGGWFRFAFEAELRDIPLLSLSERMALEAYIADPAGIEAFCDALEPIVEVFEELPSWH
jgi:hypothetical protein